MGSLRKENLKSKLQTLYDEAVSEHKYAEAATVLTWMYECEDFVRLIRYWGNAMVGTSLIFSLLYTGPFWMRLRHHYFPYNQKQLEFRRVVLLIPLGTHEKASNPRVSLTLLQATGLYAIYHGIKSRWWPARQPSA